MTELSAPYSFHNEPPSTDNLVAECAILDAFHYEPSAVGLKNKKGLKVRALYRSVFVKTLLRVAAFGLLLLPISEIQSSLTKSSNYLRIEEVPISTKAFWITWAFELFLIFILTIDAVVRGYILTCCFCDKSASEEEAGQKCLKKFANELKTYHITYVINVILLFMTWICLIASIGKPHLDALIVARQLIRPYFLIYQVTMLKKALRAMFHAYTTIVLLGIFGLFFLVPLFFTIMGFALFPHHLQSDHFQEKNYVADPDTVNEGDTYFNSSHEAYWNLIVYLSTANSPDIATPAYDNNRFLFIFFGIYYFFEGHLFLNVLKAGYAIKFNKYLKKSIERSYDHCKESFELTYMELKDKNAVKCDTIKHYVVDKLNLVNENEFEKLCPEEKLNEKKFIEAMFKIVHETRKPFNDLKDIKCKWFSCIKALSTFVYIASLIIAVAQFITLTCLLLYDYNDSFTEPHSPLVIALLTFSGILILLEFLPRGILVILLSVLFCSKSKEETGLIYNTNSDNIPVVAASDDSTQFKVKDNATTNCFSVLQDSFSKCSCNLLKWFCCGHNLRCNKFLSIILINVFELILLVIVICLGFLHVPCLNKGTYDDCNKLSTLIDIVQATIFIVVFRMLRLLAKIPLFGIILKSLIRVLVLLVPFLLLGYLFYYEFAIVGMTIFRGVNLNDTEAAAECGSYENLKYYPYNFEDFGSTLVLLWNLMIVNNWHVIVDAYVRRTSIYSRIYFVIWWVLSETVINGILLGYLIEILSVTTIHLKDVFKDYNKKSKTEKLALVCWFITVPQDLQEMFRNEADYEDFDAFHSWNIFDETYKEKQKS